MNGIKTIYRINKNHRDLKNSPNTETLIKRIIFTYGSKSGWQNPQDAKVNSFEKENFNYYLYLYNSDEVESDWAEFIPTELKEEVSFIQQKISLLLFIETEFNLFVIPGGSAYRMIIPFIDHSFGLNAYDRIIEEAEDELISMKSRGITGQKIASNEQYRDNYKIINYIKFGKIPQELNVKLSEKTTHTYFRFISKNGERSQISVGKGFAIRRKIDFNSLHRLIKEMCVILSEVPKDYLSSYIEISNEDYIDELKAALHKSIYNYIPYLLKTDMDERNKFEYDFCNPNQVEKFFEAHKHVLKEKYEDGYKTFAEVDDRSEIFPTVLKYAYEQFGNDEFQIKVFLNGVRISSYTESTNPLSSSFMFYLNAELNIHNKPIFLIDTKWYELKDLFVNDLKNQTQRVLKAFPLPVNILSLPWDKNIISKEGIYNMQYDGIEGYIIIDTIIVDGVELCDIIHFDDKNIYLIHVKYGFDARIRELTNQITISARRLSETKGSGNNSFLEKIYDQVVKLGRSTSGVSKHEFIELFSKNIIYVLAMTSQLKQDYKIEDNVDKYTSNIARFSLITCSSDVRGYYEMLTYQIPRVQE